VKGFLLASGLQQQRDRLQSGYASLMACSFLDLRLGLACLLLHLLPDGLRYQLPAVSTLQLIRIHQMCRPREGMGSGLDLGWQGLHCWKFADLVAMGVHPRTPSPLAGQTRGGQTQKTARVRGHLANPMLQICEAGLART